MVTRIEPFGVNCPNCGQSGAVELSGLNPYAKVRCNACRHVFLVQLPPPKALKGKAPTSKGRRKAAVSSGEGKRGEEKPKGMSRLNPSRQAAAPQVAAPQEDVSGAQKQSDAITPQAAATASPSTYCTPHEPQSGAAPARAERSETKSQTKVEEVVQMVSVLEVSPEVEKAPADAGQTDSEQPSISNWLFKN